MLISMFYFALIMQLNETLDKPSKSMYSIWLGLCSLSFFLFPKLFHAYTRCLHHHHPTKKQEKIFLASS